MIEAGVHPVENLMQDETPKSICRVALHIGGFKYGQEFFIHPNDTEEQIRAIAAELGRRVQETVVYHFTERVGS